MGLNINLQNSKYSIQIGLLWPLIRMPITSIENLYTHGCINVTTLLVKHYNDLLDRRSSGRGRDTVTCFYVGDVFCIYLGTLYADFQEKIFPETSWKKLQTFHCSNVTTMKSLELFPRRFRGDFFLKTGIQKTSPT